jgi:anti-anti-sigma factor
VPLCGELDLAATGELSKTLANAIAAFHADLVLDLSGVQFMDASAVGVIVRAQGFLHPRSRSLSVRAPSRCAQLVLDLCGLADLIDPDPQRTEEAGALGTWVAVPAVERVDPRAGATDAGAETMATSGDGARAGEPTAAADAGRRGL